MKDDKKSDLREIVGKGINFAACSETTAMDQFNPDHYTVIGVPRNATASEIKKAYRKKITTDHPDKQTGDEEKAKELNSRRDILLDADKRKAYDSLLSAHEKSKFEEKQRASSTKANFKTKRPQSSSQSTASEIWNANKGKLKEDIHKATEHSSGWRLFGEMLFVLFDSHYNSK